MRCGCVGNWFATTYDETASICPSRGPSFSLPCLPFAPPLAGYVNLPLRWCQSCFLLIGPFLMRYNRDAALVPRRIRT